MRIAFSQLFQSNPDGSISPKVRVHINGVEMGPGVAFGGGVQFGGVDLAALKGKDLEVDVVNGVHNIRGHF